MAISVVLPLEFAPLDSRSRLN